MARNDTDLKFSIPNNVRVLYPLVIVPGIVHVLAPSTVRTIMEHLGFRESLGGLLQLVYFVGVLTGTLLITRFMQRFSIKQIALSQVLLLSVSLFAASAAPWYALLLFFYLFAGFANGILLTIPGVYITGVCGEASPRAQNILYGFFALGIVAGPIFPGLLARWGISWRWALAAPAILILPFAIPLVLVKLERLARVEKLSVKVLRDVLSFNRSLFLGLLFALLLYAGAKGSVSMWLVSFLERESGMGPGSAHLVLIILAALLMTGRWTCGYLSRKTDPFKILFLITAVSLVLVFIAPLLAPGKGSIILYPLVGLFGSGIFPFLVGYAAWFPSAESSAVFTSIIAGAAIGGAIFPYLIGLMNQHLNPKLGMSSIAILFLGVIACLIWIKPHVIERC